MSAGSHWARWGPPERVTSLPPQLARLVEATFGPSRPAGTSEDVRLPAAALPTDLVAELEDLLGAEHVRKDDETRVRHTRGQSTVDLLRLRAGDAEEAPDAVVFPGDHDEVAAVVEWCSRRRVALVPFGGGTSVVGGLAARRAGFAGVIAVDLRRLDRLLTIDAESRTATLEAGLRGPEAEAALAEHGFTLGHFPQSFERASIGGFAATRSSGQASAGYGRFDSLVVGLRMATPIGTLEVGRAPASAAGPDLRQLALGSEGAFGVITSVTVAGRPAPQHSSYVGYRLTSFPDGIAALRTIAQRGLGATVLRLSDEPETALGLNAGGDGQMGGCLLVAGFEGEHDVVAARRAAVSAALAELGAESLGEEPGTAWAAGRFTGPYLRDALLDAGVLVETLETAAFWSGLGNLYRAVSAALRGALEAPVLVLCHISHVYETGASLYFTVAARQAEEPQAQWSRARRAAAEAIVAAGATISHHHGVGRNHLPWLEAEIGPVGVEVLRAVKRRLDPAGVLNPGVLVP